MHQSNRMLGKPINEVALTFPARRKISRPVILSIVQQISVAFRSAKVALFRPFAERKTTIIERTMLSDFFA